MRVFGIEIKKARPINHDLTDSERALGVEARQLNALRRKKEHEIEMSRLEEEHLEIKNRIKELKEEFGEGGDIGDELIGFIMDKVLNSGKAVSSDGIPPNGGTHGDADNSTLSDTAIEDLIDKMPETYKKVARTMNDQTLLELLASKTEYDDATINRIIKIFRQKNL